MNILHVNRSHPARLIKASALLLLGICYACVSAQTTPPKTTETGSDTASAAAETPAVAPLNLDAKNVTNQVAKEMSKDDQPVQGKRDVFTTIHEDFEKSLTNYENRKKISGVVEAGAAIGNLPAPRGYKSETVTCEYAAAAVNDDISKNTQVSVYAQTSTCKTK